MIKWIISRLALQLPDNKFVYAYEENKQPWFTSVLLQFLMTNTGKSNVIPLIYAC